MHFEDSSVCRICLGSGATIPIFDVKDSADPDVYFKLCQCLGEKIEDKPHFPRQICELCHITLNTATKFIEQYKVSTETLRRLYNGCKSEPTSSCPTENKKYANIERGCIDEETLVGLLDSLENNSNVTIKKSKIKKSDSNKSIIQNSLAAENSYDYEYLSEDAIYLDDFFAVPVKSEIKISKQKHSTLSNRKAESSKCKSNKRTMCSEQRAKMLEVNKNKNQNNNFKTKGMNVKKQNDVRKHLCELCGETFEEKEKLRKHCASKHTFMKCPQCDKRLTKQNLTMHLARYHATPKDLTYGCTFCGKMFAHATLCRRHEKNVHISAKKGIHRKMLKTITCDICKRQFWHKTDLTLHMRIHTGERPEVCVVCNKSFTSPVYLKEHMRQHTGEKPFECPICHKGHTIRANMKSHIRHNHRISDLDEATIDILSKSKTNYLKHMKP